MSNQLVEVLCSDLEKMTDTQVNEAWIDSECFEAARLALYRSLGLPEPVLYEDVKDAADCEDLGIESEGEKEEAKGDDENDLLVLIDIQERMAVGMKMIQECNKVIQNAQTGERLPSEAFVAWCDRRKKLWAHWMGLKDECTKGVGTRTWLWVKYFELKDSPIDCHGYSEEVSNDCSEMIDSGQLWYLESEDCVEE